MTSVYERLKNLQITLPGVPPPVVDGYVAAFVPFVRTGNVIYVSGRVAKKESKPWTGKLGANITIEEGKQAARDIAIELIATLQAAVGDPNKITRIVKLVVLVNSTPYFTEPRRHQRRLRIVARSLWRARNACAELVWRGADSVWLLR